MVQALNSGNAHGLTPYVHDRMEITLYGKAAGYSRSQGIMVLRNFFGKNHVQRFEVKHKGRAAGEQFCVGTLYTRAGNFRTSIFMNTKNGRELLKEIRFYPM